MILLLRFVITNEILNFVWKSVFYSFTCFVLNKNFIQFKTCVLEFLCSFAKRNFSVGVSLLLHKMQFSCWSFFAPLQKEISVLQFLCSFTKCNFSVGVSLLLCKKKFQCWSFFAPSQNAIFLLDFLCSFAKRNFSVGVSLLLHKMQFSKQKIWTGLRI